MLDGKPIFIPIATVGDKCQVVLLNRSVITLISRKHCSYYCWLAFLRLALGLEAVLRLIVVFQADLPRSCAFEDDLRFAAGFGAVSTSGGASGVASGSAVGVAAVSDSTFGAEVV